MRTKASTRAATSRAIFAAIFATFAIGASATAFAACGVSSGSAGTGIHPVGTGNGGIHTGVTGSTHGTGSSSCPTLTNATKLTGSTLRGGFAAPHVYTHTATGGAHHNLQVNSNISHTVTTNNRTVVKPKT